MKRYLIIIAIFVTSSVFAGRRAPQFSCMINRSVSLIINYEFDYGAKTNVVLQTKHFLEEEAKDIVTLKGPKIIDYGLTFIIVSDRGKSGYALIRIAEKDDVDSKKYYEGAMDINLFALNEDVKLINTNGALRITHCTRMD